MRGLGGKLAMLLVVASVVPLLASGAIAILAAQDTAARVVRDGHRELARRAALEIGGVVAAARDLLRLAADNRVRVSLSPEEERRMLVGMKLQFPALASLTRVAPDGTPLASSDAVPPQRDPASAPAIAAAMRGETDIGAVVAGDDLVPRVRVALPVHEAGRPVGALLATLDLAAMWRIVDDIRVGATGRVLLLDRGGSLIAHGERRGKGLVVHGASFPELWTAARAAGDHGVLLEGTGSLGERALSVAVAVPGTPWVLVLEQQAVEAFAASRRLGWLLMGIALAATVLAVLAGLRLARRRVLAPVRVLEQAAAEYGRERFEHRVALSTGDELERLGVALNDMAARVAAAREALRRAEQARALGLIAGGLAHDLKHPVAAFQALFLRADRLGPEELDRRLAQTARRETPKLAALVERLQDLGRARTRRDTDFSAGALAETVEGFRARADERGAVLDVDAPDAHVRLRADRHMLARAVENLLSNALEASPDGGRITLSIRRRGDELELAVADQGPGVPDSVRDLLFQDLASTREAHGGLGLGLIVVRQVAEVHAARLTVDQPAGGGSRFAMHLSLAALSPPEAETS